MAGVTRRELEVAETLRDDADSYVSQDASKTIGDSTEPLLLRGFFLGLSRPGKCRGECVDYRVR
jgi:hypothetical protein